MGRKANHGGPDLGGRAEGARGQAQQQITAAAPLGKHGKPAIGGGRGCGCNAFCYLQLEHQRHAFQSGGTTQPAHQQGACDIIGQVRDDAPRCCRQGGGGVHTQRIRLHHAEACGVCRDQFLQGDHGALIQFHRQHRSRFACQQGARQPAWPWPHFQHVSARKVSGQTCDARAYAWIQQEMLTK